MQTIAIVAAVLAVVAAVGGRAVVRRLRGDEEPWTRDEVEAHVEESELYDRDRLEELGVYDDVVAAAAAGEITDEAAFERLCDEIVRRGQRESDVDETTGPGRSWRAHEDARERPPPVEVGDVEEFGVLETERHHSGSRQAMGKVEGFVVFVEDVPDDVTEGDVVRAKVMYFNRGKTSATATLLDVVG